MTKKKRLALLISVLAALFLTVAAIPIAVLGGGKKSLHAGCGDTTRSDGEIEFYEDIDLLSAPMLSGTEKARDMQEDVVYLSDIPYLPSSSVGWGSLLLDQTDTSGARITLNMNGSWVSFDKGIYAHANSNVYYDLTGYEDYDYFQTYFGVNSTSNNKGDGVKFWVYTSHDGTNWTFRSEDLPAMKSGNSCGFLKIDVRGWEYLRLQCYQNANNGNDHSCWADAKLVKSDYKEFVTDTVEEYDTKIRARYDSTNTMDDTLELMVLQRYLVDKIGAYQLKQLYKYEEYQETFDWLFNDLNRMRTFINGGAPEGTWFNTFVVLSRLYHAYKADLNDTTYQNVYLKQMFSIALVYSRQVAFWIKSSGNASPNTNVSDPVVRYNIYKTLLLAGKLNNMYTRLEVEEMRMVVCGEFADDEAIWLNDYTRTSGKSLYQPYSFIFYKKTEPQEYRQAKYYGDNRKAYENKYKLTGYNIANDKYYPKTWMIMQNGGQCWQVALLCVSALNANGIPAYAAVQWPVGKTGHQAFIAPWMNNNGDLNWGLYNDAYGWDESSTINVDGDTRRLYTMRLPLGWGHGDYVTNRGQATYLFLGQAALNNYSAMCRAAAYVKLADSYTDASKKEAIYKKAIETQSIHFDAWLKLVDLYRTTLTKTDEELATFISDMCDKLKGYPLPMHDLHRRIAGLVTNSMYQISVTGAREQALNWAKTSGSGVAKHMANCLLGQTPTKTVSFSFSSTPANKLVFQAAADSDSSFTWDYSIDGGNTWKTVYEGSERILTHEEVEALTVQNDILVHIIGLPYTDANYFRVDLTQGAALTVMTCANNNEKAMRGVTSSMEWRYVGDEVWTKSWAAMALNGEVEIEVRNAAVDQSLPGPIKRFKFTEMDSSPEHTYISLGNATYAPSAKRCSSENSSSTRMYNAFDALYQGGWVSNYETAPYIDVEIPNYTYLSRVQWISATGEFTISGSKVDVSKIGIPVDVTIQATTTGKAWDIDVISVKNLTVENGYVNIDFEPVYTRYLRIYFNKTTSVSNGKYLVQAGELAIFRDITKIAPDIDVSFDILTPTNGKVTATLTPAAGVSIPLFEGLTYNESAGTYTYVFTENKRLAVSYTNAGGNASCTIDVDWIDKTPPIYKLVYNTTTATNGTVTVVCNVFEQVEFGGDGKNYHTFEANGTHIFHLTDMAGNTADAVATVTCIDRSVPVATVTYLPKRETDYPVTADIVFDKRVELLNNNGEFVDQGDGTSYRYVFRKNGSYVLRYRDLVGNAGETELRVDWIRPGLAETFITYESDEITDPDNPFNSSTTWGNVTATLTFDENDPVTVLNNGGSFTHLFYENGVFEFEYRDTRGNVGKAVAEVNWIEKELPVTLVTYDKSSNCLAPVTATFVSEETVTVINNNGGNTYTFTENGSFVFLYTYTDSNGNLVTGVAHADVDWIDSTPPTAEVIFNYGAKTDRDVVVTLVPDEHVTVTNNGGSFTYTFTENGSFTFEFVDAVGLTGTKTVSVDWIDRAFVETAVSYDVTEKTGGNVTATLIFSEGMKNYSGSPVTYVFTENGEHVFLYADENGNVGAVTATVTWIDKTPPVGTVTFNVASGTTVTQKDALPVIATLSCDKPVTVLNNGGLFTREFEYNGSFTFEFVDEAGNVGTATATVNFIRIRATVWVEYSTTQSTADAVTVTLKSDRPITVTSYGGAVRTVNYSGGVILEFTWRDETGYNGSLEVTVDWAKCNVPAATVSYSTTAKTNGNVTATLSAASGSTPVTVTSVIRIKPDGTQETIATTASSYEFTENGKIIFVFENADHVAGSTGAEVTWIDRVVPEANVSYSTKTVTANNVTATLSFTKSGVTITDTDYDFTNNGNGTYGITFTENGTRRVNFRDAAGNTNYIDLAVTWIDKVFPEASVNYSTTTVTAGAVTAKITFTKPSQITDEDLVYACHADGSYSVTFTENGTKTVHFRDASGNENSVTLSVDWIDTVAPEVEVTFSTTDFTVNDVTAYLTFSESVTIFGDDVDCRKEGENSYSLLFNGNMTKTVRFKDAAGNENSREIKVDWIDRMFRSVSVSYSTQTPTTGHVTVTLTFNCDVTILNTDVEVRREGEGVYTVVFVANGAHDICFRDEDGYESSVPVAVSWIGEEGGGGEIDPVIPPAAPGKNNKTAVIVICVAAGVIVAVAAAVVAVLVKNKAKRKHSDGE